MASSNHILLDIEVQVNTKAMQEAKQKAAELKTELDNLKTSLKELSEQEANNLELIKQLKSNISKVTKEYRSVQKVIKQTSDVQKKLAKNTKQLNDETDELKSNLGKVGKQADKTGEKLKDMADNAAEASQKTQGMNDQSKQTTGVLETVSKGFDLLKSSFAGAKTDNEQLQGTFEKLEGASDVFSKSFGFVKTAVEKTSLSFKTLGGAIAATGIGLLVVGFQALVGFLTKTEKGTTLLNTVMTYVSATVEVLSKQVAVVGEALFSAFQDPQQALKDLGNFIVNNLVNRFTAIIDLVSSLGSAVAALARGDFSALSDAASDAGTALVQMGTGLDAEQQKKFADAVKGTADEVNKLALATQALEKAQKELAKSELEAIGFKAKQKIEIDNLKEAYNDETKSINARANALKKANELETELIQKELDNAKARADIIKKQKATGDDSDDLAKQEAEVNAEILTLKEALNDKTKQGQADVTSFIQAETEKRKTLEAQLQAIKDESNQLEFQQLEQLKALEDQANMAKTAASKQQLQDVEERYAAMEEAASLEIQSAIERQASEMEIAEIRRKHEEKTLEFLTIEAEKAAENAGIRKEFEFERLNSFEQQRQKLAEYEAQQQKAGTDEIALARYIAEEKKKINQAEAENFFKTYEDAINKSYDARKESIDKEITDEQAKKEALLQIENERIAALGEIYTQENVLKLTKEMELDEAMAEIEAMRLEKHAENEGAKKDIVEENENLKRESIKATFQEGLQAAQGTLNFLGGIADEVKKNADDEIKAIEEKGKAQGKSDEEIAKMTAAARKKAKKAAIAGAWISAFQSAITAFNSAAAVPIVGPVLGGIAAATALAFGIKNVNKIKAQEYATGGLINTGNELPGFSRSGDNTLILAQPGELILNQRQQGNLGLTPHVLKAAGVPGFATGGFVDGGMSSRALTTPVQQSIQEVRETQVPVLVLEDFETKQGTKVKVENALSI